jgi:hypothetical protein
VGYDSKGWYWFREVPVDAVRPAVRAEAERMLGHVGRDLGLPNIRIRWFRFVDGWADTTTWPPYDDHGFYRLQDGATPRSLRGRVHPFLEPDVIWVRATLPVASIGETVAHEARHLWQYHVAGWPVPGLGEDSDGTEEADAFNYELMASVYYRAENER